MGRLPSNGFNLIAPSGRRNGHAEAGAAQAKLVKRESALDQRDPLAIICGQPFDPAWFEALPPAQQSHAAWAAPRASHSAAPPQPARKAQSRNRLVNP